MTSVSTTTPITGAQQQAILQGLGYTGTFGAGGAQAWLAADPSRQAAYNQQSQARQNGYTGAFGGGGYQSYLNQQAAPVYGAGGVQTVGVVEPLNNTQENGLAALATPYTSPYSAPAVQNYNAASTAAQAAAPQATTNNNTSTGAYTGAAGTLGTAGNLITQGATPLSSSDFASGISSYMNPYSSDVVNATNQQLNQEAAIQSNALQAKAPGSLSFGDTSTGVAQGAIDKNLLQETGNADSALNYQGYNDAVTNINNTQNRLISGGQALTGNAGGQTSLGSSSGNTGLSTISDLANLATVGNSGATTGQQLNTNNATNTVAAGTAIQDQNQLLDNATQTALAGQSGYSQAQLQALAQLLGAFPTSNTQVGTSQSTNQGSTAGGVLGQVSQALPAIASLAAMA